MISPFCSFPQQFITEWKNGDFIGLKCGAERTPRRFEISDCSLCRFLSTYLRWCAKQMSSADVRFICFGVGSLPLTARPRLRHYHIEFGIICSQNPLLDQSVKILHQNSKKRQILEKERNDIPCASVGKHELLATVVG